MLFQRKIDSNKSTDLSAHFQTVNLKSQLLYALKKDLQVSLAELFVLNSSRPFTFASDLKKLVIIISTYKGLGPGVVGQIHIIYWMCIVDTAPIDAINVITLAGMSWVSGCRITSQPFNILGPSSYTTLVMNNNNKKAQP